MGIEPLRRESGHEVLLDCEVNRILLNLHRVKILSPAQTLGLLCAPLLGKLVYHTEESFATTGYARLLRLLD